MLIELWRKVLATDYSRTHCGICGNDFDRGTVFPVAFTDHGGEVGELCPACLDYLNRRKQDGSDPTAGPAPWENWPARQWPTVEDLEEARLRYPEPMFADDDAFEVAAPGWEEQEDVIAASFIWRMEREAPAESGG
ncbi:MAG: hypothetical protein M3N18_10925 [Actinomycetota bacterium]|nr:hypothetical protein [Actinomycetota bacterium]